LISVLDFKPVIRYKEARNKQKQQCHFLRHAFTFPSLRWTDYLFRAKVRGRGGVPLSPSFEITLGTSQLTKRTFSIHWYWLSIPKQCAQEEERRRKKGWQWSECKTNTWWGIFVPTILFAHCLGSSFTDVPLQSP
jgi:hypothetical protein